MQQKPQPTAGKIARDALLLAFITLLLGSMAQPSAYAQGSRPEADQSFRLRMSTVVDNVVGLGAEAPAARLVLELEDNDLCLLIAIPPDPTQLQAELFKFKRRIEGQHNLETLKFKFKKPEKREDRVRVWETCIEDSVSDEMALDKFGSSFIEITYRDPRSYRPPVGTTMDHPLRVRAVGLDILKDSAGTLQFQNYNPPVETETGS
jgi:hypothetical protein